MKENFFNNPIDENQDPLEIPSRLLNEIQGTAFPGTKNCLSDGPIAQQWGTQIYRLPIIHRSSLNLKYSTKWNPDTGWG